MKTQPENVGKPTISVREKVLAIGQCMEQSAIALLVVLVLLRVVRDFNF